MDFEDSPQDAAFRAEVREWLAAHAKPRGGPNDWSRNSEHPDYVENCKQWQHTLYEGGWGAITWPVEYGGRGLSGWHQSIFNQEAAGYDVSTGAFAVGIGMCGPTLIAHGTEEQKQRYLPALIRGEEVWCQLFSEPEAGSDLAGLKTRAIKDGDEFVVNGQKVWNSGAHQSDWGILLTRTDPDAPKHKGITYFLVDMRTPGIEVRPLVQITGHAHFNEVFLTDVRIPAENVVGDVNAGWGPTHTTLANERTLIGGGGGHAATISQIKELAKQCGRDQDPVIRQDIARAHTRIQIMRFMNLRVQTASSQGKLPGPEASTLKLFLSQHQSLTGDLVMSLLGTAGMLAGDDAVDQGHWQLTFLNQWSSKIGGGTDQIQRNTIGERVLGLPAEPRVDKDLPFKDLAGARK
ncbi:MAG: acyl-CoA dehydrogenase [Acidimicrobiales bacterium]|nr:acyl-CoA dehydrogenase [Acidimicrobiales bacterium]